MHKQKAQAFVARIESRLHLLPRSMQGEKKAIEATCDMMKKSDDFHFLKSLGHAIRALLRNTDYRIYNESWNAPLPEDVEDAIQTMCGQINLAFGQIMSEHPMLLIPHSYGTVQSLCHKLVRETYLHLEAAYTYGHWDGNVETAGSWLSAYPKKAFRSYKPGKL